MHFLIPLFAATEIPVRSIQRLFSFHPVQQWALWIQLLAMFARSKALATLGAGKLPALGRARFEAHGTGMVTSCIATGTSTAALTIHVDNERFLVGHPDKTLCQAHRAAEAAEQMSRGHELDHQQGGGNSEKQSLVSRELGVPYIMVYQPWR